MLNNLIVFPDEFPEETVARGVLPGAPQWNSRIAVPTTPRGGGERRFEKNLPSPPAVGKKFVIEKNRKTKKKKEAYPRRRGRPHPARAAALPRPVRPSADLRRRRRIWSVVRGVTWPVPGQRIGSGTPHLRPGHARAIVVALCGATTAIVMYRAFLKTIIFYRP